MSLVFTLDIILINILLYFVTDPKTQSPFFHKTQHIFCVTVLWSFAKFVSTIHRYQPPFFRKVYSLGYITEHLGSDTLKQVLCYIRHSSNILWIPTNTLTASFAWQIPSTQTRFCGRSPSDPLKPYSKPNEHPCFIQCYFSQEISSPSKQTCSN